MTLRYLAAAGCIAALSSAMPVAARAQPTPPAPVWTFSLTPYGWLPSIGASVQYQLPNQVTLGADQTVGVDKWLSKLHFVVPFAADAQYDRLSVFTDFLYLSLGGSESRIKSVSIAGVPSPISPAANLGASLSLQTVIWTLAGGYTVANGTWGNVDALAGFRLAAVTATTNFSLGVQFFGPGGNGSPVFGGAGSVSGGNNLWNGIAGLRGRVFVGDSKVFVPYYLDVGTGGSKLTWQAQTGVGYQLTTWADLVARYRYMSFEQYDSAIIQRLTLSGGQIEATFHF